MNIKNSFVIGISGASCSGKTWLANIIKRKKPEIITIFSLDNYYKNISFVNSLEFRHDNPESIDYASALKDLKNLTNGIDTNIPEYDYETHAVTGHKLVRPTPITIIEGLFVFYNEKLRNLLDLKIWVECDKDTLLSRRIQRDIKERGDNYNEAFKRYTIYVIPAYNKYIEPYKIFSDIIVNSYGK